MKKIAILGTAPTSRDLAPYDDAEWEIWVCSPGNQGQVKRVTRWFELHAIVEICGPENKGWSLPFLSWLNAQAFPVYMQEKNDLVPRAMPFPLLDRFFGEDSLEKKFRKPGFDLLNWTSSSITMMIALALDEIAKAGEGEIAIFGVDMAADQEHYTSQKAGCWRMLEIAQERGVPVRIPKESSLGRRAPIYGYNEASPFGRRLNAVKVMLLAKRAELVAARDRYSSEIIYMDGALEQLNYTVRTWVDGADADLDIGSIETMMAKITVEPVAHAPIAEILEPSAPVAVEQPSTENVVEFREAAG